MSIDRPLTGVIDRIAILNKKLVLWNGLEACNGQDAYSTANDKRVKKSKDTKSPTEL
jgi:hypothetical protein